MKKERNIYYLISILIMFLLLIFPTNDMFATIWGIHMFFNIGWTIMLIIEYFKK